MDKKLAKNLRLYLANWSEKDLWLLFNNTGKLSEEKLLEAYNAVINIALERLDEWCSRITNDSPGNCYSSHSMLQLSEIIAIYIYEEEFSKLVNRIETALEDKMGWRKLCEYIREKEGEIIKRLEDISLKLLKR
ncbi:MAG: hypothetical protein QXH51_07535 [Candidatus Bathyarchaeia archaeon]